jgi:AraC-like DNA-binding protein
MGTFELALVGLTGSGVGAVLGVPLLLRAWRRSPDPQLKLIAGGFLGLAAVGAIISGRVLGFLPATPGVNHALNLTGLACYPLIYMYVRAGAGRPLTARRGWWLWLPFAAYSMLITGLAVTGSSTRIPFQWLLPVMLAFTAMLAVPVRWREGDARTSPALVPGTWIVVFFAVLNLAQIARMLFGHAPLIPALIPAVVSSFFIGVVGLIAWRAVDAAGASGPPSGASGPRYAKSNIDSTSAQSLLESIDRALSTGRLFADSALTLPRLAAAVDSTPHQVSEVLNRYAGVSFHDLLNRRRVDDVKAQLQDTASDRFTIEGIGASAGFGSRSALYAAFRKLEGMTPKEWKERRP